MLADALAGIRVLDLTQVAAGPLCTMILGDLGADVIKLEPPGGDLSRALYPSVGDQSVNFLSLNRNKRSLVLDLKEPAQVAAARRLAAQADVLVESFRPGVADKLSLGWQALSAVHPGLVYCSISAYGQQGPQRHQPGVDGVLQAVSGLMSINGFPDTAPCKVQIPIVDVATGHLAAIAVLAALARRQRDGLGQHLDISLYGSAVSMQQMAYTTYFATGEVPLPAGSAAPYSAPNEALRCADGWIMVAAYHPARWRALCEALDAPELLDDPQLASADARVRHRARMIQELEARLMRRPRDTWIALLQQRDIICGPIHNYREAAESAQFLDSGLRETVQHPTLGEMTLPRSALHAVGERPQARRPPPLLGEHTAEVLDALSAPHPAGAAPSR